MVSTALVIKLLTEFLLVGKLKYLLSRICCIMSVSEIIPTNFPNLLITGAPDILFYDNMLITR
jgi:hypothetical protein